MHEGQEGLKKVFFVIPALTGGGAERVMLLILKSIDRNKIEPILVLFEKKGEFLSELPDDIDVKVLKGKRSRYGLQWLIFFKLAKLLAREQPDLIVSFMWYANLVALLAKFFSRSKCGVIVSERYGLSVSYERRIEEIIRGITIFFFYPKADSIIVNSKEMGVQLNQRFRIAPEKITVIYNPIDLEKVREICREDVTHPWCKENIPVIVSAGRLTKQKGFSYLIKAVRILNSEGVMCRLMLLGEGDEKESLKKLVKDLKIDDNVDFVGFQKNPYKYFVRSTVFVLSSLYEGFPNVLLEALALGVPSVATRCPTGPEELITDGLNGILVPPADEKVLAAVIKRLLTDEALRKQLSEAGRERARDFDLEKISKQYENIIIHGENVNRNEY